MVEVKQMEDQELMIRTLRLAAFISELGERRRRGDGTLNPVSDAASGFGNILEREKCFRLFCVRTKNEVIFFSVC